MPDKLQNNDNMNQLAPDLLIVHDSMRQRLISGRYFLMC
jgi:hypothetical protein